jgi:cell division protein FtsB
VLAHEEKKVKWKRVAAILGTTALSIYTIVTLQGPHGIGALRAKLARIQELHEQQGNLSKAIEEKKKRVESLEKGVDIEMEMRRYGRTLPDEVEYKVAEPKVDEPAEDASDGKKAN